MKYLAQLGGLGIAPDFVKITAHNKNFILPELGDFISTNWLLFVSTIRRQTHEEPHAVKFLSRNLIS